MNCLAIPIDLVEDVGERIIDSLREQGVEAFDEIRDEDIDTYRHMARQLGVAAVLAVLRIED